MLILPVSIDISFYWQQYKSQATCVLPIQVGFYVSRGLGRADNFRSLVSYIRWDTDFSEHSGLRCCSLHPKEKS